MKPKLLITVGYPGCGKSTLAKELVAKSNGSLVEVNRDDLRRQHPDYQEGKFTKTVEAHAKSERTKLIKFSLTYGRSVICSDTNLTEKGQLELMKMAYDCKAEAEIIDFTDPESKYYVPIELCIKRDLLRRYSVGKDVILKMFYKKEMGIPQPDWHKELPNAYIFDVDGTLAHTDGKRSPFEERYEVDSLDRSVHRVLTNLKESGNKIIIVSGREGSSVGRQKTLDWLSNHEVNYDEFYMRNCGDRRSDTIVKREIYEKNIKFRFNIIAVFDDRKKVCREWQKMGLTVFWCGPEYDFDIAR